MDRLPEMETEKTNLKRFIYNCFVYAKLINVNKVMLDHFI